MELNIDINKVTNAINYFKEECKKENISQDDMETMLLDCLELCDIYFGR